MVDEDSAAREGSGPVGPQEGEKALEVGSEVLPQPVAPETLAEPAPASGAGTGALVEASQAETAVVSPAPSVGEAGVGPAAESPSLVLVINDTKLLMSCV